MFALFIDSSKLVPLGIYSKDAAILTPILKLVFTCNLIQIEVLSNECFKHPKLIVS